MHKDRWLIPHVTEFGHHLLLFSSYSWQYLPLDICLKDAGSRLAGCALGSLEAFGLVYLRAGGRKVWILPLSPSFLASPFLFLRPN